jgi:hypothetical protein
MCCGIFAQSKNCGERETPLLNNRWVTRNNGVNFGSNGFCANIWPWVPAGLDTRSKCAGWLPAVSYCSALLYYEMVSHLTLNRRNIPFVNSAKYLGVVCDRRVTWRLHIEMIEAKALRTFIRLYSLFKSERLSANIKLTLHKALTRSVMTYASPAWEFAADTHLMKSQRLQNKVLRTLAIFQGAHRFTIYTFFFHWHYSPSGPRPTSTKLSVSLRFFSES